MKVLAGVTAAVFLLAVLSVVVPIDPAVTVEGLIHAWQNPDDPTIDSTTYNTYLEIRSYVFAFFLMAIPGAVVGLIVYALMR